MKTVAQREPRNRSSHVLREVEAGEPARATVAGRPIAELTPVGSIRRRFVRRDDLLDLLQRAPLDNTLARDLAHVTKTINEL
jgi:prevent-host-death family protein